MAVFQTSEILSLFFFVFVFVFNEKRNEKNVLKHDFVGPLEMSGFHSFTSLRQGELSFQFFVFC